MRLPTVTSLPQPKVKAKVKVKRNSISNQAVKRNIQRFPSDFMFRLTLDEWDLMRSQNVTASRIKTIIKSDSETNKMFQVSSFKFQCSHVYLET